MNLSIQSIDAIFADHVRGLDDGAKAAFGNLLSTLHLAASLQAPAFGAGPEGVPGTGPAQFDASNPYNLPKSDMNAAVDTPTADALKLQAEHDAKEAAAAAEVAHNKLLYGNQGGGDFGQP